MIARGDVFDAEFPSLGVRPAVIVTRESAIPVLSAVTTVPVTSTIRGHPAEVVLNTESGLDHESAANCDNVQTVEKTRLLRHRGRLGPEQMLRLDDALRIALQLD
ncbi:MAG: type II toxin-antitoxin system PemK/MazF family toxin [Solirubrobacterales bacterium]